MYRGIILQPHIPHYREDFFKKLSEKHNVKIYCYTSEAMVKEESFEKSSVDISFLKSYYIGPFMWFNPFKMILKESSTIVLMLDFKHLSTWVLLLTRVFHKKKVILWGQGISIKRYLKDEKKPLLILKWMLKLADGVWFYTEKEKILWKNRIPELNAVALNNTISNISDITAIPEPLAEEKNRLKEKYKISQPIILIFCARFTADRRTDLLLEVIQKVDKNKFGFIIIGEGSYKPSFINFSNVYDFGKVYDFKTKTELFHVADIYFQPAWLGLSVVEAMGYGKPVFTFVRSEKVLQCVEYYYVQDNYNGKIFNDVKEMISYLNEIELDAVISLGKNAKKYVKNNLSMDAMVANALKVI